MAPSRCLDERKLEAWLVGDLSARRSQAIEEHIAACKSCRKLVERLESFQDLVELTLDCPEPEELALWAEGSLSLGRARFVRDHLSRCSLCEEESAAVADGLDWLAQREAIKRNRKKSARRRRASGIHRASGSFKSRARPSRAPLWIGAGIAAAAALLLFFALTSNTRTNTPRERAGRDRSPIPRQIDGEKTPEQRPQADGQDGVDAPKDGPKTTPEQPGVDPLPEAPEQPQRPERPDVTPEGPEAPPQQPKAEDNTPELPPKKRSRADFTIPPITIDHAGGALASRLPEERDWTSVSGAATIPPSAVLMARGDHGYFDFGGAQVMLRRGSQIILEEQSADEARVRIERGEAYFEVGRGSRPASKRFVARAGATRAVALGTRFCVARAANGDATLIVTEGKVAFGVGASEKEVSAGQGAKVGANQAEVEAMKVSPSALQWTRAAETLRSQGGVLSYPDGFFAFRALRELPEAPADLASRARAWHALEAATLDPALRRFITADQLELQAAAKAAFEKIAPAELGAAAADILMARVLRAHGRSGKRGGLKSLKSKDRDEYDRLEALAEALAANTAKDVDAGRGLSVDALLALKLASLAGIEVSSRDFWKSVTGGLERKTPGPVTGEETLALVLLPTRYRKQRAAASNLRAGLIGLEQRFAGSEDSALTLHRAWLLGGKDHEQGRVLVLDRLSRRVRPENPADRILALTRPLERLLTKARRPARQGPTVVITDKGAEVTFRYRPGPGNKQRAVFLCGSWDDWKEEATPMQRLKDGSFEVTKVLPLDRYEYKFRMGDKDHHWYPDPTQPLETPDGVTGTNSILDLR